MESVPATQVAAVGAAAVRVVVAAAVGAAAVAAMRTNKTKTWMKK